MSCTAFQQTTWFDEHALQQIGEFVAAKQPSAHRRANPETCVAEPPSSTSPWAALQARAAKRDRPTSARPILPAHCAVSWSLSRPLASLNPLLPNGKRVDLTLPDAIGLGFVEEEANHDNNLDALSQTKFPPTEEMSSISVGGAYLHDLSQQWLHTVEISARKAEPAGPKNLTRYLLGQKLREVGERKARMLDVTVDADVPLSSPLRSPRRTSLSPLRSPRRPDGLLATNEEQSRWQEVLEQIPFVRNLPYQQKVILNVS
jgi:hypothetical protein